MVRNRVANAFAMLAIVLAYPQPTTVGGIIKATPDDGPLPCRPFEPSRRLDA